MRVRSRTEGQDVTRTARSAAQGRRAVTTTTRVAGTFQAALAEAEDTLIRADLDTLLRTVDEAGAALKRWRGREQLEAYRRAVKSFLAVALERMYRISQQTRFDARGRRVKAVVVELIDAHLEALTAEVIHGASSAIPLAARLDEIRGLLLDLYG